MLNGNQHLDAAETVREDSLLGDDNYRAAMDRLMGEIEELSDTRDPRLDLAEERIAS